MQKGIRLKANLRQKSVIRLTAITAGIALMAGIGIFIVANFSSSTETLASGKLLQESEKAATSSIVVKSISPNPFDDEFLIDIRSEKDESLGIFLYDATGKRVAEHITEEHAGNLFINMNPGDDLPPGLYVLMVVGEDMIPQTIRLQKI
jgi:hypothetical protein